MPRRSNAEVLLHHCTSFLLPLGPMRRLLLIFLVLLIGMAGVVVYTGLTQERDFQQLIQEGDLALSENETFLAIEAYSGALALSPDSMVVYLKRGETYQQHGDLPAALRDLSMAAQLDPTATRAHDRLGDITYQLERYDEAIDHYTDFVRLDDQNSRVLYKLALVSERSGRIARAVPLLRQAIALEARFAEAHYLLGLCLREQGRLEEARDKFFRAIELSPGFLKAREALAAVHRELGDRRGDLQPLDTLAALDHDHPERHVTRGLAYARTGEADLAVLALGRAAEDHPAQPQVYAALGKVWLEIAESRGDHVALGKALEALLSVPATTASSETLTLLGRSLELDGDVDSAGRAFRQATERFPLDPMAFVHLARLEELRENWDEARRLRRSHQALATASRSEHPGDSAPPAG